jgi:hypothetical protein
MRQDGRRKAPLWNLGLGLALVLPALAVASPKEPVPGLLQKGSRMAWIDTRDLAPENAESTVVLEGMVWYEDHRVLGQHSARTDLSGNPARGRRSRADRQQDFVGAYYMDIDIFEQDDPSLDRRCERMAFVGHTSVRPDGSFSVEVPATDPCPSDAGAPPRYVVQVAARHCDNDICVEVGRRVGAPFALWFGFDATIATGSGGTAQNQLLFEPRTESSGPSHHAMAANHFASLADSVRAIHLEGGVPFRMAPYGPVTVRFPSPWSEGRATSATLIDARNEGWPKGNLLFHEYGHIVHRRAWGGDYAGFPVPVQPWNPRAHSREIPFIAMKEGWAIFLSNYAIGRCDRASYDLRNDLHSITRGHNGLRYPQNHHRAFCDLVDDRPDFPGEAVDDTVALDLRTLWSILDQTDDRLAEYPHHDPIREGLDICDVMATYTLQPDPTDSAAVERAIREAYGVLYVNDIWCPNILELYARLPVPVVVPPPEPSPEPLAEPSPAGGEPPGNTPPPIEDPKAPIESL